MTRDERTGVSHLVTCRISAAAAKQRAGRAGRVRPGRCVHLYCEVEAAALAAAPTPEILRRGLAAVALRARLLCPTDTRPTVQLLGQLLQPPTADAAEAAEAELVALGALLRPARDAAAGPRARHTPCAAAFHQRDHSVRC